MVPLPASTVAPSSKMSNVAGFVVENVLKPAIISMSQQYSSSSNVGLNSTTTQDSLGGSDVMIQWSDIFSKKVLFFVFVTGPIWIAGHLLDRGLSQLFVKKYLPDNFDIHIFWVAVSQVAPTCTHLFLYLCNVGNFKNLFDLDTTMERLRVPEQWQPLFKHIRPRNEQEFDKTVEIMNGLVTELAASGIDPHSSTIFDLSSPARPNYRMGTAASSTSRGLKYNNSNSNNNDSRFKIFSRLFGGDNTVGPISPINSRQHHLHRPIELTSIQITATPISTTTPATAHNNQETEMTRQHV